MTTDNNNNSSTSREQQLATHQQQLMASFENMGLMGGTTTSSSNAAPMAAVAPPPASAPPLPPPDSPVKHQQQTMDTGTTNSSSTMVTGGMMNATNNGVNHHDQQTRTKEQHILTLMDSLTGSLPNVVNDDNGGGGLFGDDDDDQEDEMLFLPQQQQPQQSYDSAFSNNLSSSGTDEEGGGGTLISDAATAAIPSQSFNNNNNRNQVPAMAPLDSSFYRNHDEALPNNSVNKQKQGNSTNANNGQQRRAATQPTPVISTTLRRDRSNSNHSLGSTTSTLTANTSYQQPTLPIKQRGGVVNGNGNSNKQQSQQPKKKKVREPFVIPDYIRDFRPMWANVTVSDPRQVSVGGINKVTNLLASVASGGMTSKYWVYTVSSTYSTGEGTSDQQGHQPSSQQPQGKTIHVQRRFRHFDALQERLRDACPGAILPSRPAKHSARAIEEGTGGSQSTAAFVSQRAKELHNYLNALIQHPIAGNSEPLQFFLTFLDTDLGTAWPEVSNSALTRLTVGMTKTAAVATGATSGTTPTSPQHNGPSLSFDHMSGGGGQTVAAAAAARAMDDNSDLIELSTNESHRMNLIHQSIPQLESFLVKLSDYQEAQVGLAMEYTKLSKLMGNEDRPLTLSSDVISHGLLRTSRRTRRAVVEGYAALDGMLQEPRTCRMEKAAFQDRREAFVLWWNVRQQAEHKSSKVVTMRQNGIAVQLHKFEAEAAHFIQCMDDASDKVNDISVVLQSEVIRLKRQRQTEWMKGLKIWTCSQKETYGELTSIWQDAKAHHERIFQSDGEEADEEINNEEGGGDGNSAD